MAACFSASGVAAQVARELAEAEIYSPASCSTAGSRETAWLPGATVLCFKLSVLIAQEIVC